MLDPKTVMTEDGMEHIRGHVFNMKEALFYILNHADDLRIGSKDSKLLETLYEMQEVVESGVLVHGNGEVRE